MAPVITFNPRALEALHQRALDAIETSVAADVAALAARYAPTVTGNLAASIRVHRAPRDVQVGSDVEYASEVELGTGDTPAQPYLRPALKGAR